MKKENKIIIVVSSVIVLLVFIVWFSLRNTDRVVVPNNEADNNSQVDNVENNNAPLVSGENTEDDLIPVEIDIPADLDWRDAVAAPSFEVGFMTSEEKEMIGIADEKKVQVLSRDEESGLILAYKIIESDDDIVTGPQK